jgi:hypothetical protein
MMIAALLLETESYRLNSRVKVVKLIQFELVEVNT